MNKTEKGRIRRRDRSRYGTIPEGYCMHHLWYSEEYNPESFVIITKEEHCKIHGFKNCRSSDGFNQKEYVKEWRENNPDCEKRRAEYKHEWYMRRKNAKRPIENSDESD